MNASQRHTSVLTIAGSDSGGGAGIQADLKTFTAFGLHGLSAITAVTAQNTQLVSASYCLPSAAVAAQIQALFDDFDIRAVKIGMLGSAANVAAVAECLQRVRARNIVLDPVLVSSSGTPLLTARGLAVLRRQLLPIVDVLTPNLPEAGILVGRKLTNFRARRNAARELIDFGPSSVLLKGGHARAAQVSDHLADAIGDCDFQHPRLRLRAHGTGCTLSAAIAAGLALDRPLRIAVADAIKFLQQALAHSYRAGKGAVRLLDIGHKFHD